MAKKISFAGIWQILKETFKGFSEHNIAKLSGSLAYSTVFSMGPLLVVIISLCGMLFKREAIEGKIYGVLNDFFGEGTAHQLQDIIRQVAIGDKGQVAAIVGGIVLFIGATAVFAEIQDSINTIWGLKPKPERGLLKLIRDRFLSFSVIVSLGFLLLVSLAITALIEGISTNLQKRFPDMAVAVFYIINLLLTVGLSMLIFAVIFRVLPDARIKWKDVTIGAFVTTLLFLLGKFAISFYITKANIGSTYGAAGSLVILLVWVYYSSIILYIGAEFTKAYAMQYGSKIQPNDYAVTISQVQIETEKKTIQQNEKVKEEQKAANQ